MPSEPEASSSVERGRLARQRAPRSRQAELAAASDRDPVSLLEAQNAARVAELVPLRDERMLASPFAFYRGAPLVMAHDLAAQPSTGLHVQLSGDAHLLNFGGFASPERNLVFDLNDFDETLAGPFEWDVKRLATSVEIAGRARELGRRDRAVLVRGVVREYRSAIRRFASMGDLDVWYSRLDAREMIAALREDRDRRLAKQLQRAVTKAQANDGRRAVSKLTRGDGTERRFVSEPPLVVPMAELASPDAIAEVVREALHSYGRSLRPHRRVLFERFHVVDIARKVVGVGSVGTRCWVVLLLGRDDRDPLVLQLKEAGASVLEDVLGPSGLANHAQRVVEGQRLMQASSDIFLGWMRIAGDLDGQPRDYYIRQLRDWKASADIETLLPRGLARYGAACAWTLARAHSRSGDRVAIAAYIGGSDKFEQAVAAYAVSYADLTERDHGALADAVARRRTATTSTPE